MLFETTDNPFVGLRPFETEESLLFFGRQQQTLDLLNRLHQHNFVGITGSSGSGKSSLVRAGLIPKLKAGYLVNDRDKWIITITKPGQSPMCNLAEALLVQMPSQQATTALGLEAALLQEGIRCLTTWLQSAIDDQTNLFILVDQFEEIFRFSMGDTTGTKKEEAISFVQLLLALAQSSLPVYITFTMRSDFIGDCAQVFGLPEALNKSQYLVPRLSRQQMKIAIEGPVRLYAGSIEEGLTARLLNDVATVPDELPLLQHALMRMWEIEQASPMGQLTIGGYEATGGISNALSQHAEQAYHSMNAVEQATTEKLFQALTGIDEKGRKIRRPAKLSELVQLTSSSTEQLLLIIERFITDNRNFLVKNASKDSNELVIDISHESLIRQWARLNNWVEQEATAAEFYSRLAASARLHNLERKDLLTGNELAEMNTWFNNFSPSAIWALRYDDQFEDNIAYLQRSVSEERRQRHLKKRNRLMVYATAILIFFIVAAFALYINNTNNHNKKQLVLNYWTSSQNTRVENNWLSTLHLLAEAANLSDEEQINMELLMDVHPFVPITELSHIRDVNTKVNDLAFSTNGHLLAIAANNGTVQVFDRQKGMKKIFAKHQQLPVNKVIFNKAGNLLLTAGNNQFATIYDVTKGSTVATFQHNDLVNCATFAPGETKVLTACKNGYVYEWDIATGKTIYSYLHPGSINWATYNGSGSLLATAGNHFSATLWNATTHNNVASFEHRERVSMAIFSPNDSTLLTTSWDSTARLWNVQTHQQTLLLQHSSGVTCAAFHPTGKWVATGSSDKKVRVWDVTTGRQVGAEMLHQDKVHGVAFSSDGHWLATTGGDEKIRLWKFERPKVDTGRRHIRFNTRLTTVVYSPDGQQLLTAGLDSTARLWDANNGTLLHTLLHKDVVNTAQFSTDGTMVITAAKDFAARIWNSRTGILIASFPTNGAANCATLSPDNQLLFTADNLRTVTLWNVDTKTVARQIKEQMEIRRAMFSPLGTNVVAVANNNSAYIYNNTLNKAQGQLSHEASINAAVYSADGAYIITTSDDFTARVWHANNLQQYGPNLTHKAAVTSGMFDPAGTMVVTGGWDLAVHQWSLLTFKELGQPRYHNGVVTAVGYSPAGNGFVSVGYDSTLKLWSNTGDLDLSPELLKIQAQALSGAAYNFSRGETQCMPVREWEKVKENYSKAAKAHATHCKFTAFNQWLQFHP